MAPLSPAQAQERLNIVATTGMIADAAHQVGGERVEVRGLMGPGVDPHAYRQTRTDILAMMRADLVLWHGLYLEAQMESFLRGLEARRRVVALAEFIPPELLIAHDTYKDHYDPHIWMDPELWQKVVGAVRDVLIEEWPEHEAEFRANAEKHLAQIAEMSAYAKQVLATVPEGGRALVTAHDAFNYFARAYDFEVLGVQGISTESEAGLNRISELVDVLVQREISAVFVESSVSDRNIRALVEGAAARGHKVEVGGQLFSDAMGRGGTYEGTYIGMIDHNVTTIARALGGEAPERGMHGRLAAGS
ncbi:zinc ABC transporter substrate-binding protein [Chelativorans sp. Marseille-P2723]|uniref:metal ABC transporter solute-binding protein, Zn/Mn family n=1 Tax=Chelativorans sp. Marseille-P2723 TaxID=2709133 RepID=UPI001FEE43F0|nr:zinc ABC transporter substrate-binding protein [Chelativorans sp. Marseille-P2723]